MTKSLLKRLLKENTPLIDGNLATFVWQGTEAPRLVGDFTGWERGNPVEMVKYGRGLWTFEIEFPPDAYIEYGFEQDGESIRDPHNPRVSSNGVGGYNHYFSMPEHKPTGLTRKHSRVGHGSLTSHRIATGNLIPGEQRTIHLYQPPVEYPAPLLVVWDGQDYIRRMHLHIIVDNLIYLKRIQPLAMAFIENGGQKTRTVEYGCSDATLVFLMSEVLPLAKERLKLLDIHAFPGVFGVTGASMGGLMALYTGARIPQVFGKVLSQSGAFSWDGLDMVVFDLLGRGDLRPIKLWLDVGIYDIPGLLDANRRMKNLIGERGYTHAYREYNAGHNYPAWRDEIWRGLEFLYGIP